VGIDELMRINEGYAWAGLRFNVVARPTVPGHSFMTSQRTMQTVSCSAPGARQVMATSSDRAAPGALKFIDGTLPRPIRHRANTRLRRTPAK
jgi:hypothetical protein